MAPYLLVDVSAEGSIVGVEILGVTRRGVHDLDELGGSISASELDLLRSVVLSVTSGRFAQTGAAAIELKVQTWKITERQTSTEMAYA